MLYLRFICDGSETALDCRDIIEVLPLVEMQPANLERLSGVLARFRQNPVFQEIR